MKYIISERQYKVLTEDENQEILELPSIEYFGDWIGLDSFLKKKKYPLFSIAGDLWLDHLWQLDFFDKIVSVEGTLSMSWTSVKTLNNLKHVGGWLNLLKTDIESLDDLKNLKYVGKDLNLNGTPFSNVRYEEIEILEKKIREQVEVGGKIYLNYYV